MTEELFGRAIQRALASGADPGPLHDNATVADLDDDGDAAYWRAVDHEYLMLCKAAGVTPLNNF